MAMSVEQSGNPTRSDSSSSKLRFLQSVTGKALRKLTWRKEAIPVSS